jgi:hypothetical protein
MNRGVAIDCEALLQKQSLYPRLDCVGEREERKRKEGKER